jgi:hypothetical protein
LKCVTFEIKRLDFRAIRLKVVEDAQIRNV